jgi:hypothetical protein
MDRRARMWKTLGCLVVAMTGTSAMLGWMDPTSDGAAVVVTEFEITALVRESVDSGFSADTEPAVWREVEISPGRSMPTAGSLLAARRGPLNYHFYVDRFGRPMKTVHWRRQQAVAGRRGVIRIQVEPTAQDATISAAQRYCVRQLIETLSVSLTSEEAPLAVRWPQDGDRYPAAGRPVVGSTIQ